MIKITDFIPKGRNNAVSMDELATRTGLDKRTVRQAVFNARRKGVVICSSTSNEQGGYFLPLDISEAIPYYREQLARIKSGTIVLEGIIDFIGGEIID